MHPMEQMCVKGYSVWNQRIEPQLLYDIAYNKTYWDTPDRGHDINGVYHRKPSDDVKWANYWTGPLNDHLRIADIRKAVDRLVAKFMVEPVFYHADVSVLTPSNSLIRPHVDTPHRHEPWNAKVANCLGMQVAIKLSDFDILTAGSTAFVPGSFRQVWDIKKCYRGEYTEYFLKNAEQPDLRFGDVLIWDARTLHSQMPNISGTNRYMLLLNYIERRIVPELMDYESILHA